MQWKMVPSLGTFSVIMPYIRSEISFSAVKDSIDEGLRLARQSLKPLRKIRGSISSIRVCSFNVPGLHIEVRWDWKRDGLDFLIGPPGRNRWKWRILKPAAEAVENVSSAVLSFCEHQHAESVEINVLGS